jgi:hypothetical protein
MLTTKKLSQDSQCSGCDLSRYYTNTSQTHYCSGRAVYVQYLTSSYHHKWKSEASLLHQLAYFRVCQPSCFLIVQYLHFITYKVSFSSVGTVTCLQSYQVFTAFFIITGYQKECLQKLNYINCREWPWKRKFGGKHYIQHACSTVSYNLNKVPKKDLWSRDRMQKRKRSDYILQRTYIGKKRRELQRGWDVKSWLTWDDPSHAEQEILATSADHLLSLYESLKYLLYPRRSSILWFP